MATPTPTPTLASSSSSSSDLLDRLISPGTIAGIAISVALTITVLAVLFWCCCRRRRLRHRRQPNASKRSIGGRSSTSRLGSETPTSELGFVHEPAAVHDTGATGRGAEVEEPPPAYFTLEHTGLRASPRPLAAEMGAGTGRAVGSALGSGMEAWNGEQLLSERSSGASPWKTPGEVATAPPSSSTGRDSNLRVDTDVIPMIHVTGENGEEDEDAEMSRSVTYSTYSVGEAAVGTVALPSIVHSQGARDHRKP